MTDAPPPDPHVTHLQALLARLERARAALGEATDTDTATAVLADLNEIAQEVAAEVERQRRALADDTAADDTQLGLL
jgi:hypothetical protein